MALNKKQYWFIALAVVLVGGWYLLQNQPIAFEKLSSPGYGGNDDYDYAYEYGEESLIAYPEAAPMADFAVSSTNSRGATVMQDQAGGDGGQKVLQSASLSLHVEDVRKSLDEVTNLVNGWGGYVENSNLNRYDGQYSAWLSLRVPADQLEVAISTLKDASLYIENEYRNAEDVTETYLDLSARLENMKAEEEQYQSIMVRAESVEEILQVTDALSRVRGEIESLTSRLQYYDTRVDLAQLSVSLSEDASVVGASETWRPISTIRQATSDWIVSLQGLVDQAIYLLIYIWPLLIVALVIWIAKRGKKKKRK